jgi:3-hydroxybutyryl-CoA dehydrogenase
VPADLVVGVVGCGTMGMGIAHAAAVRGCQVIAVDTSEAAVESGRARLAASLASADKAGQLSEPVALVLDRVRCVTDLGELRECGAVVEAVIEDEAVKVALFGELSRIVGPRTLLATNTSSIPVTRIAAATTGSERVVGLHFFNPVPRMRLVEVVPTLLTDEANRARAVDFVVEVLGKSAIVAPDRSGFVVNVLLVPYLLSAIRSADAGLASYEDIDEGMVAGCGMPMGPLRLADLIGLDTLLLVAESLYAEHLDPAFAPPVALRRLVEARRWGRKSGHGFYAYA